MCHLCLISNVTGKDIVFRCVAGGLGVAMLEDLAPGSSTIQEIMGIAMLLSRAEHRPHRQELLDHMLRLLRQRRDEISEHWLRIRQNAVRDIVTYEAVSTITWAAIHATAPGAQDFMRTLIARGWELSAETNRKGPEAAFCSLITSAADSLDNLKERDTWVWRSFEPVATLAANLPDPTPL